MGDALHQWGAVTSCSPNFTPISAGVSMAHQKLNKNFTASEYKRPIEAYPLRDFYEIFVVCMQFHM